MNLLDDDVFREVGTRTWPDDGGLVTPPVNTTNTIWGNITNVQFTEAELIKRVIADPTVIEYHCNFGVVTYPGFVRKGKKKATNRGRKPVQKIKKERKRQGNGNDLNSQVTMVIRRDALAPQVNNEAFLQPKIFRNGKVQIPGVHMRDVHYLKEIIESRIKLQFPDAEFKTMNLAMSNYRWQMRLQENVFVNMRAVAKVVEEIMEVQTDNEPERHFEHNGVFMTAYNHPYHPKIFSVELKRGTSKLSIKFLVPGETFKTILLNIFRGGRTNVQGVYDPQLTTQIWDFIKWLFHTYPLLCHEGNLPAPTDNVGDDNSKPIFVY